MLRHIVMWKFKPEAEGRAREENMEMMRQKLLALPQKIDFIRSFEVGRDVCHTEKSYDMCLVSEFDSMEKMLEYREHPDHVPVSRQMKKLIDARVVIDYEF